MSDTAREKAYIRSIERRFNALRESGLYISPRDFGLLLDWHERGVPAELVILAIEEVFRKAAARGSTKQISTIAYCRRAVETAWQERRAALLGSETPAPGGSRGAVTREEVAAHLESCAAATEAAAAAIDAGARGAAPAAGEERARAGEELRSVARRLRELRAGLEERPSADFQALETELVSLEERSVGAAKTMLSAEQLDPLARVAEDSLAPFAARMSEKAKAATLRRAIESAIRSRFALPRCSLFAMNR